MKTHSFMIAGISVLATASLMFCYYHFSAVQCPGINKEPAAAQKTMVYGVGAVRGTDKDLLCNKYSGFVSQVNFSSNQPIKKGDVILTYDDLSLRQQIQEKEKEIADLKTSMQSAVLDFQITQIDPLPSDFRNLAWKKYAAEKLLTRMKHEKDVYVLLAGDNCVSDLDSREKTQCYFDAEANLNQINENMEKVKQGLEKLYINKKNNEIKIIQAKLMHAEKELVLLQEEKKYYRIVAPFDGECICESDTVGEYDPAGTYAAAVHAGEKIIQAYFDESEIRFVREDGIYEFRSNQYNDENLVYKIKAYYVDANRTVFGEKCMHKVKFRIMEEPKPLRIDSNGIVCVSCNP